MSNDNPPADHVVVEDEVRSESQMEQNLKSKSTWLRLVFMVLFYILAGLAGMVGTVVAILGFLWVLFTGKPNPHLRGLGQGIAGYLYQIVRYVTYNSEQRPFPFELEWPSSADPASAAETDADATDADADKA